MVRNSPPTFISNGKNLADYLGFKNYISMLSEVMLLSAVTYIQAQLAAFSPLQYFSEVILLSSHLQAQHAYPVGRTRRFYFFLVL